MIGKSLKSNHALLLGLGRANLPVGRYLSERGAKIYLYEDNVDKLSTEASGFVNSTNVRPYETRKYDLVIASPGFPIDRPIIKEITALGNRIVDEVEFTFEQLSQPSLIAVTGTNGKSTTVGLISAILNANDISHFMGGNIAPGKPFSEALFLPRYNFYVLEISSFQLMRIVNFRPHIGVITNITSDHMNWHSDFNEYRNAKLRLFKNQDKDDYAVISSADPELRKCANNIRSRTVLFGHDAHDGSWLNGDFHFVRQRLFSKNKIKLIGRHNQLNIMAAIAVAKILDLEDSRIENAVVNFETLPHRLEEIATEKGVRFINNSMCTNEAAAIASFKAFPEPKIVIVGGKEKGDAGLRYLELLVREAKYCVILGDNAAFIEDVFRKHGYSRYKAAKTMKEAVIIAREAAVAGDIVILNPGYASFDFFANFEDRGEVFRRAVHES